MSKISEYYILIITVCKGNKDRKASGGFKWMYEKDYLIE
jgi:hypothetical protein